MKLNYQYLSNHDHGINSFWVRANEFGVHWHYHPEIEICYVKHGQGHRIVGNSVAPFQSGDLVLVGSNLPHCWISDKAFNAGSSQMEVFVIHIHPALFTSHFDEFNTLHTFLENAKKGVHFELDNDSDFISHFEQLENQKGLEAFIIVCAILNKMMLHQKSIRLSSAVINTTTNNRHQKDINAIVSFIQEHYTEKISLAQLAGIQNRNVSSFCRYFKKQIGKTPTQYVNELRINDACNKLLTSKAKIYEIAFDCGFQSLTHFNKIFKRHKSVSPKRFRANYV